MFWASLCPSSGEQRPCYCIWCVVLVLLDVVGSGCGALSCSMRAVLAIGIPYSLQVIFSQLHITWYRNYYIPYQQKFSVTENLVITHCCNSLHRTVTCVMVFETSRYSLHSSALYFWHFAWIRHLLCTAMTHYTAHSCFSCSRPVLVPSLSQATKSGRQGWGSTYSLQWAWLWSSRLYNIPHKSEVTVWKFRTTGFQENLAVLNFEV